MLVSNDGHIDQLLRANQVLREQITDIKARRTAAGEADVNPSLANLERKHVPFVNAHYKPYVGISFQYFNTTANNATLGWEESISIPQYSDFFADMAANVYSALRPLWLRVPHRIMVVLYRHCDYLGEHIFDEVRFEVNSNPIDSYTSESYVLFRQFCLLQNKMPI
ncbi:hypothetical protein PF008_g8030 [Phytophthora fragariae]|uniref:Uncharacterized protein n=1 Tax=Phytophthora fragariae TaxID=53985 RepID=A0A6G0S0R6_9STRA|nr:hypothetical protein PF008_g8030 [Phytophthora fragariae]